MSFKRVHTTNISRSSNNLELGISFEDKTHSRYCSSTPSDIHKQRKNLKDVPPEKAFIRDLKQSNLRERHDLPYDLHRRTNHSSGKYISAFDRRKSHAFRRRINPQLRRHTLISPSDDFQQSSPTTTTRPTFPTGEEKSKLRNLYEGNLREKVRRSDALPLKFPEQTFTKDKGENFVQAKAEKPATNHLVVSQNLSWSPPTHTKAVPYRPRVYSSHIPEVSKLSRSIRIKKWVQGMRVSDHLDEDFQNSNLRGRGHILDHKLENGKLQQMNNRKASPLAEFEPKSGNLWHESVLPQYDKNRARKLSQSTGKCHPLVTREDKIAQSISSSSSAFRTKLADLPVESTYLSWSNQSEADMKSFRLNALRDKLSAKGQPLTILNLLDDQQPAEALKMAREGHSRVRMDVCLLWSCMHGDPELVSLFLTNGANPEARDAEGFSALHIAAESGCEEIVGMLIREGVRVTGPVSWDNRGEITPLMLASKYGYADIVSLLLQRGADVDAGLHTRTRTGLYYAVRSGSTETVQVLIDAGATINPLLLYSETPLHIAVEEGHSDVVDILLKAGADVRASRGHTKITCLHISAQGSYYHITHQLLKAAADPNQEDSSGQTALHVATRSQCYDTVQILLNYKANPNARDREGKTPLHTGIFKGSRNFECLKLLLESKADPNIPDNAGYTPLHLAALHDSSYCVKLYLKHGADMTRTTKGGVTALNIILRRTPDVMTQIQENLNDAINFVEHDQQFERDGQIQLDFRVLLSGSVGSPECRLLSCFIEEGQKSFMKHPLCETFLFLKWLRVRSFFIFNVIFYMILVFTLTQYFYLVFTGTSEYHHQLVGNETKMSQVTELVQSVNKNQSYDEDIANLSSSPHPRFHLNFEEYCLSLPPHWKLTRTILLYIIWVILSVLTLKEGFQVLESPKGYLSSLDNILVWPVIFGSFIVTISSYFREAVCPWEYHMAALIILFSWLELLLLIGRFPTFGLYVHMFAQVTTNFGKFLFAYICLINAFSLSFGILFHNQPPFKHRFVRLLKTLVMMTGEIEYNEWFYESKWEERILYNGTSHLVFAMFLLFGTIILMNLLVGLAVSDIQGLQKSAGLDRLVRQTHLIAHFEAFMFSRWLAFLMPQKVLKMMHSRILLLNSMYGSMFILNPKTFSSSKLPEDVIESIKRLARNRDYISRRRNAFTEFRTLSNSVYPSASTEDNMSRGIEALKCGLDLLVWETEDHQEEMLKLRDKISTMNTLLLEVTNQIRKGRIQTRRSYSEQESSFISCQSGNTSKSSIYGSKVTPCSD